MWFTKDKKEIPNGLESQLASHKDTLDNLAELAATLLEQEYRKCMACPAVKDCMRIHSHCVTNLKKIAWDKSFKDVLIIKEEVENGRTKEEEKQP